MGLFLQILALSLHILSLQTNSFPKEITKRKKILKLKLWFSKSKTRA